MPLKRGKAARTKAGIAANIRAERRAGRPADQSVAIALDTARRAGADIPKPKRRKRSS